MKKRSLMLRMVDVVPDLEIPEVLVATKHGKVILLSRATNAHNDVVSTSANTTSIKTIFEFQHAPVRALASHPSQPEFAIGGDSGVLEVTNYETKCTIAKRTFEVSPEENNNHEHGKKKNKKLVVTLPLGITSVAYSPDGQLIGMIHNGILS